MTVLVWAAALLVMALVAGIIGMVLCPPWTLQVAWSWTVIGDFAFIVLFGTVAAFWLYLTGLRYISPVVSGLVVSLEPLSAIFFSMILLNDVLGFWQTVGVVFVVANLVLLAVANRR